MEMRWLTAVSDEESSVRAGHAKVDSVEFSLASTFTSHTHDVSAVRSRDELDADVARVSNQQPVVEEAEPARCAELSRSATMRAKRSLELAGLEVEDGEAIVCHIQRQRVLPPLDQQRALEDQIELSGTTSFGRSRTCD